MSIPLRRMVMAFWPYSGPSRSLCGISHVPRADILNVVHCLSGGGHRPVDLGAMQAIAGYQQRRGMCCVSDAPNASFLPRVFVRGTVIFSACSLPENSWPSLTATTPRISTMPASSVPMRCNANRLCLRFLLYHINDALCFFSRLTTTATTLRPGTALIWCALTTNSSKAPSNT